MVRRFDCQPEARRFVVDESGGLVLTNGGSVLPLPLRPLKSCCAGKRLPLLLRPMKRALGEDAAAERR